MASEATAVEILEVLKSLALSVERMSETLGELRSAVDHTYWLMPLPEIEIQVRSIADDLSAIKRTVE